MNVVISNGERNPSLDPSHSLGMTGLWPVTSRLGTLAGDRPVPGFISAPLVRARDLMAEPLFTVIAARLQHRQANFQGRLAPLAIVRHGLV